MKRITFADNDAWLESRRGKVTGTRVKDIVVKRGTKQKKGFYELIAERIAIPRDPNENRMDRGHTLESEAVERLAKETGLPFIQVDNELWTRDDNPDIAFSPDGYVPADKIEIACEIKCINSASHLEAVITGEVPNEYIEQTCQAFIVNEDMQTLYFAMYDPSLPPTCDFFMVVVHRADIAEHLQYLVDYEKKTLAEIDEWVDKLTF